MNFFSNFILYSQPYLNTFHQCYQNIVTINVIPEGPLRRLVFRVRFPPLSEFKNSYHRNELCGLALLSLRNNGKIMLVNEIPDLFSYLLANGYQIDTSLTKMMNESDIRFQTNNANKVICFVTYKKKE
jgi:hypothetical protein